MKKLNTFLGEAAMWKIFTVMFIFGGGASFIGLYIFPPEELGGGAHLRIAAGFALLLGLVVCAVIKLARSSEEFWEAARTLNKKIDAAEDKKTLQSLHETELRLLYKKAGGEIQWAEIKRLRSIMETKYKFVK